MLESCKLFIQIWPPISRSLEITSRNLMESVVFENPFLLPFYILLILGVSESTKIQDEQGCKTILFWSWSMQNRAEKMSWMKMGIRVRRRIHTHFFTEITACTCKSCLLKMPLHTHLHNGPPPHIKIIFCVVLQACNILQLPRWTIFKFAKRVFIYNDTFCHKSDHELGDLGLSNCWKSWIMKFKLAWFLL